MKELLIILNTHILFIVVFFITKRPRLKKDNTAIILLIVLLMPQLTQLLSFYLQSVVNHPVILIKTYPLTYGPLLYYYLVFTVNQDYQIIKKDIIHFVPFVFLTFLFLIPPPMNDRNPEGSLPDIILRILISISLFTYSILIFKRIKKHRVKLKEHFSYENIRINLVWLQWLIVFFVISYLIVILGELFKPFIKKLYVFPHGFFDGISISLFTYAFTYFSLKQAPPFSQEKPKTNEATTGKYEKSGLKETDIDTIAEKVESYMKLKKPFLDNELTIVELASQLGLPRHHIAQVINVKFGKNFYNYVNEYRIQNVIDTLKNSEFDDYTLLRIALDSGFNSKSTFNTVFKRLIGISPSEYRSKRATQ
jgi:AraC-like DNA-binding protein